MCLYESFRAVFFVILMFFHVVSVQPIIINTVHLIVRDRISVSVIIVQLLTYNIKDLFSVPL